MTSLWTQVRVVSRVDLVLRKGVVSQGRSRPHRSRLPGALVRTGAASQGHSRPHRSRLPGVFGGQEAPSTVRPPT